MKEAIKVDLNGLYVEPVLVPLSQTGVMEVQELPTEAVEEQEESVTGYIIAEKVPEGLYKPRWDFSNSVWVEGLTQKEIDEIRNAPQPITTETRVSQLESENVATMLAVSEVYETSTLANKTREQEAIDTMLGLAEAYEMIVAQQAIIDSLSARVDSLESSVEGRKN